MKRIRIREGQDIALMKTLCILVAGILLLVACQGEAAVPIRITATPESPTPTVTSTITTEPPTPSAVPIATAEPTRSAEESLQGNDSSGDPTGLPPGISADGRRVVFASYASNLVPGDTNTCQSQWAYQPSEGNCLDIFAHDRETGTTRRVSIASDGAQSDGESFAPVISADGRWVAFRSRASNLTPDFAEACTRRDYPDNCSGIYVHDLETGQTELLVVMSDNGGIGANYYLSISADGRFVAFWSYESSLVESISKSGGNLFVYDRQTQEIKAVMEGTEGPSGSAPCQPPGISATTPWMAFSCPRGGIFVIHPQTNIVEIVSRSDGTLSADGRYVAFASEAGDLVPDDTNECANPQFGRHNCSDIFVYDAQTGQVERVSVASNGTQSNGESYTPSISADGRFVVFASDATNLVPNDTNACRPNPYTATCFDIFIYDRETRAIERVSITSDGVQANNDSRWPRISADGRWVVFISRATNLVAGDTNEAMDVFVHDRETGRTERVSVPSAK